MWRYSVVGAHAESARKPARGRRRETPRGGLARCGRARMGVPFRKAEAGRAKRKTSDFRGTSYRRVHAVMTAMSEASLPHLPRSVFSIFSRCVTRSQTSFSSAASWLFLVTRSGWNGVPVISGRRVTTSPARFR